MEAETLDNLSGRVEVAGSSRGSGSRLQPIHHVNPDHHSSGFLFMNLMRQRGKFCDVRLHCTDVTEGIAAHKLVLASCSPYFDAMFSCEMTEKDKSAITMHALDSRILQLFVDYAYTGEILISEDNVQELLPVASLLQVESVREACCMFLLKQLHPSNCLGIRNFADAHSCKEMYCKAHNYTLKNFQEVALTEEFLVLPFSELHDLIASDQMNVESEEIAYKAIITWIRHDATSREKYFGKLLNHVRLPLTNKHFLLKTVAEELLLQGSQEGKDQVFRAMKYHMLPEERGSMVSVQTTPRKPEGLQPYLFVIGGRNNSGCHCECEFYNPRTDRWAAIASSSHRRSGPGVAAIDRLVYVVGGYDGSNTLCSGESYNPLTNKWSSVHPMGTKRDGFGMAALHGLLYVAGGDSTAAITSTASKCMTLWLQPGRQLSPWTIGGGAIYAVGGRIGGTYHSTVERLDPREGKWQRMPDMSTRRSVCGVAALDGMLYVAGGYNRNGHLETVEMFDPVKGAWEVKASMSTQRWRHEVVGMEGYLYAIGGRNAKSHTSTVERYDPKHNKWTMVTSMTLEREYIGATMLECPNLESVLSSDDM